MDTGPRSAQLFAWQRRRVPRQAAARRRLVARTIAVTAAWAIVCTGSTIVVIAASFSVATANHRPRSSVVFPADSGHHVHVRGGRSVATAVAAVAAQDGAVPEGGRSWREAAEEAKLYEMQLRSAMTNAGAITRELDRLFVEDAGVPDEPAPLPAEEKRAQEMAKRENMTDAELFGLGDLVKPPQLQPAPFAELEERPPILSNPYTTGKPIVGAFAGDPRLAMPRQRYGSEFLVGTVADPTASQEENDLWEQSLRLLVETLEPLYPEAEAVVAGVPLAEARAESRRGPVVDAFRKRVIQQMIYATDGFETPDQLDEYLTTLQTDKRLLKWLGLLERTALEAEALQAEIRLRQKEAEDAPPRSRQANDAQDAIRAAYDRTRGLDVRIRTALSAARDNFGDQLDAYKEFGDALDAINPFKMFR